MHPSPLSGPPLPSNSSGIKVIIIGCGIAGLGCAIACTQKGHKVVVFQKAECNSELESLADDVVTPTPKVGRFVERWGLGEKLHSLRRIPNVLHLEVQPLPDREHDPYVYITQMHELLLAHALSIGVEMRTGLNVIAFRQNEIVGKAGIILDNGERIEGDVVVCVGVGNFGREDISGEAKTAEKKFFSSENNPSFDIRDHGDNISRHSLCNKEGVAYPWTGSDVRFDTSGQSGKAFTHSDESNRLPTTFEADMDGCFTSVNVSSSSKVPLSSLKAQSTSIVDCPYRDPLPTWTDGRLLIIGGQLLSTNAYDTSQAIEEGVVLAITLHLAGRYNVLLAVKAWERIRHHHRVRLIDKSTRGKRRINPTSTPGGNDATSTRGGDKRQSWLPTSDAQKDAYEFDAEKDAYERYSEVMLSLLEEAEASERRGGKCAPVAWL